MEDDLLIPAMQFCDAHNVELSFIKTLQQSGLIEMTTIKETAFIYEDELPALEKLLRLHHDLDINTEGLEVITHLLQRINDMYAEIFALKNKLWVYETKEEV